MIENPLIVKSVIEGLPIPTFVIGKDHRVIFWNRACEELTGFHARDIIGTDHHYMPFYESKRPLIADLIVDQDFKALERYYGTKQGRPSDIVKGAYEARDFFLNLGGRSRHLYFLAAPIYDEKGEIIGAIETLQDVTKERELELSLKEYASNLQKELERNITLQKTLEGVIEGSPIPAFVINKSHRIIFWNKACEELTGYSAKEMLGTDLQYKPFYGEKRPVIADLIVDSDFEALDKYYGKKKVQRSAIIPGAYEAWDYYENLGGKSRHLYFLAAPIYDEAGDIIAAIETLQDITRQRELEQRLMEYAESLQNELTENINLRKEIEGLYHYIQSILDSSPDTLFELNEDGIITYVSRGRENGTGPEGIVGKHFSEYAPKHKNFLMARWEEIKKGNYKPYEIESTDRTGQKRTYLLTPRPVKGRNRYVIAQRDITEFKELERKVYEAEKLAAIGQLSAGIAHEIRNPLSSIKMSLQILEKRLRPTGNDLKRFQIALREVEHLENLVNDVLIYARPGDPKKRPSDIRRIVENALEMVEKAILDKEISVVKEIPEGLPPVDVDDAMMQRAFLNIMRNAIEAMENRGILLIKATLRDDKSLQVEFHDTGCGISEEDLTHVFNPFFTKKRYGTGLGMAHVKRIIDLHEGNIDIRSKLGEGTCVMVTLKTADK
ncbi:MAG: PAS domain S-box protein [Syntrophales bacterium]|nr:PAS domain S-box protein [Syntrophales bacterium]